MDEDNKTIRQREEQIKILRNSVVGLAELMLWFARLMANERDELKRTLARKNENVENLRAVGKDAAFRIMTVIDERNEARAIACKLLTERNEAQVLVERFDMQRKKAMLSRRQALCEGDKNV